MAVESSPFTIIASGVLSNQFTITGGALSNPFVITTGLPGPTEGTPIPTPIVFPFEPNGDQPIQETTEFATNIITSQNDTERRIALRRRPRMKAAWQVLGMDPGEAGRLAGLLWDNVANRWYVPLWQYARRATAIVGGVYSVDMNGSRYDFGTGRALVWKSSGQWDLLTIVSISPTSISLSGAVPSFPHVAREVFIVPVAIGSLTQDWSIERTNEASMAPLSFELDTTNMSTQDVGTITQLFKGEEVLTIHPNTTGTEKEAWVLSSERSGGDLGTFFYRPYGYTPVVSRPVAWLLNGPAEFIAFRQFLARRRGRKTPCWVATYQDDFTLAAPSTALNNYIDIKACGFAALFAGSAPRAHLAIFLPTGQLIPVSVVGSSAPATGIERLSLSSSLGVAIPVNCRVSFLIYSRLTDDAVVVDFLTPELATVSSSFTDLPRETPP